MGCRMRRNGPSVMRLVFSPTATAIRQSRPMRAQQRAVATKQSTATIAASQRQAA